MSHEGDYSIGSSAWPGLAKLVEEMGELTTELMKLIAKGGDAERPHWDGRGILLERITNEVADVRATLIFFCEQNGLDYERVHARAETKLALYRRWQAEASIERGRQMPPPSSSVYERGPKKS